MTIPLVGTDMSTVLEPVKSQQTTLTLLSEIVSHLTHLCLLLHLFTSLYFLPVQRTCFCSIYFIFTSCHHSLQSIFSPSPTIPTLQSPLPGLPLQPPFCSTPNQLHASSPTSSSCSHVPQQTQSQYHPIHPPLEPDDLAIENMLSDQSLWEDLKTDNEVITSESPYVSPNTPFNSPPFVPPPPKQSSFTHHPAPEQSLFTPLFVPEFSSGHPPVPRQSIQPPTAPEQSLFTPPSAP